MSRAIKEFEMEWIYYMLATGDGCFGVVLVVLLIVILLTPTLLSLVQDKTGK